MPACNRTCGPAFAPSQSVPRLSQGCEVFLSGKGETDQAISDTLLSPSNEENQMPDTPQPDSSNLLGILATFFKDVKESLHNIAAIGQRLDGDRSVVCEVDNSTKLTLNVARSQTDHGGFSDPLPKQSIG